ncbi:hypothetical protein GYMLUDRAFT_32827 [Collybiopsis luxurians FD-317 M1]|nr:hypothetical protein GYMLUDRAFT_32827 [Collybiopsis luxurians FD-317 M1]
MLKLGRQINAQCFFCNTSILPPPRNPRNFRCSTCGCWNRYDANGEILSDEPAMHEESLNSRSFLKRASPSKDRIPTSFGNGPFCHNCQTNQHLIVNLLSNYLPPPTSPEYEQRLEMLPQYRESLYVRYPPVCETCLPAVEDEIRKKDAMARTQALGGWLKETKGKARQRRVSATLQEREKVSRELFAWRIRGFLWGTSLISFLIGYAAALLNFSILNRLNALKPAFPFFVLLSVLWTAWDPTYASIRTAQIQGRDVRVQGKRRYNVLQMIVWVSRLITASLLALQWFWVDQLHIFHQPLNLLARLYLIFFLALELFVLIASFFVLRLQHPPAIRLINTQTHDLRGSRSPTPNPTTEPSSRAGTPLFLPKISEPDLLASLSLSSQPVVPKNPPVFGLPSLLAPVPATTRVEEPDEDAMDWSPTDPGSASTFSKELRRPAFAKGDDGSWLRPQRFFAPEKPTGLESLFEKTNLDDVPMKDVSNRSRWQIVIAHFEGWYWIYAALSVLLMGISVKLWISNTSVPDVTLHSLPYEDVDDRLRLSGVYRHTSRSNVVAPQ